MPKKIIAGFCCAVVLLCSCFTATAYEPDTFTVRAEGCVLASLDTGELLYQKNENKRLYPASLTKIMTATVVLDTANDLNEVVTAGESAIAILQGTDSSTMGLQAGEQLSVLNLLYTLLVHSANDAANILAEHFGNGSIAEFVEKMNQKAAELGMQNTHYVNAHGLHDENHYTTPYDMYLLTRYALKNETFKKIVETVRYTLPATNKHGQRILATTNFLQDANSVTPEYFYKYAGGVKTGYTDEAGRCLVSTATKNGETYLCVLMKSPVTNEKGVKVRYEFPDSKNLYEWAFKNFEYRQIYDTSTPVGECPVALSAENDHVAVLLAESVNATLPKNADNSTVEVELHFNEGGVQAPVSKGQKLGTATVKYAGQELATVDVVAMNEVQRSTMLYIIQVLTDFLHSPTLKLILTVLAVFIILLVAYCLWLNRHRKKRRRRRR